MHRMPRDLYFRYVMMVLRVADKVCMSAGTVLYYSIKL